MKGTSPAKPAEGLYDVLPADHRLPYNVEDLIVRIVDADDYLEFQPHHAPEMLCANARLGGRSIALIANRRGFLKTPEGPRIGGIVYTESATKVAYFVETAERLGLPLVYFQDVSGFMVGTEAESGGIIRAGAAKVESIRWASVDKIGVALDVDRGAGYIVMNARLAADHQPVPAELEAQIARTRADYERWLDARHAAARGHVDALLDPLQTRRIIEFALEAATAYGHRDNLTMEML
jgi:acetyl-CoA carboxylase carboxyltransferase component